MPLLVEENLFTISEMRLKELGSGSTHLYSTAPVNATFNAIFALIPELLPTIRTVVVKKEVLIEDDTNGSHTNGKPHNLLRWRALQ